MSIATLAALVWTEGLPVSHQAPEAVPLAIERVSFDKDVKPFEHPVRLRIVGSKPDVCYVIDRSQVSVHQEAAEIRVTLTATLGTDKPCRDRAARFRLLTTVADVPPGTYEVVVNGIAADDPMVIRELEDGGATK